MGSRGELDSRPEKYRLIADDAAGDERALAAHID